MNSSTKYYKSSAFIHVFVCCIFLLLSPVIIRNLFSQEDDINCLLNKAEDSDMIVDKIYVLNKMAWNCMKTDPDKAYEYGRKALKMSKDVDQDINAAMSLINTAYIFIATKNDFDRSMLCFKKAYKIAYTLRDTWEARRINAEIFNGMGLINYRTKQYEIAVECYKQALQIFQQQHQYQYASTCFHNLGCIYSKLGNMRLAEHNFHMSLEYSKKIMKKEDKMINPLPENASLLVKLE